jgi:organic radical activating enzyme
MTGAKPIAAAALAGVPAGVQAQGVWAGRRQLFVRFAGEAETATMYTATALVREIERQLSRSKFHSLSIGGRDPLANVPFLQAALEAAPRHVPVMLDTDGQRPAAVLEIADRLALVQVTVEFTGPEAGIMHAVETLKAAAQAGRRHALVLSPREDTTDAQILRIVEQAASASAAVEVVIHPTMPTGEGLMLDRRWSTLLEQAMGTHADCTMTLRLPPPAGLR